jgi:Flp pilus assembly protein TadD
MSSPARADADRRRAASSVGPREARDVSELLDLAREQAEAGDYKHATRTLKRVEVLARYDVDEAHGLLDLAMAIKDKGGRRVRRECDYLCLTAEQIIKSFENAHVQ